MTPILNPKEFIILSALSAEGAMTADEFVTRRRWYVNSWAPTFTRLRERGYVERTGETRPTSHGAFAYVIDITDAGRAAFDRSK